MRAETGTGAAGAPPPNLQTIRVARIQARIGASAAVAGLLAGLAFGAARRDHDTLLWAVTLDRTAQAGAVRS